MTKVLITYLSSDIENEFKDKDLIYLGPITNRILTSINNNPKITYAFNKKNKKEKIESLKYCESVFEKIFNNLTDNLNAIHEINYSRRIWKIIFGRWLKDFIYISYKAFVEFDNIFQKNDIQKTISLRSNNEELVTDNSASLINSCYSIEWHSKLSTRILEHMNIKNIQYYNNSKISLSKTLVKKNLKLSFVKSIINLINKFNFKKRNFLFYDTSLSFFAEKKLELLLNEFPSNIDFFDNIQENSKINDGLRSSINLNFGTKNNYEKFLEKNLSIFLPKYVIENFREINDRIKMMKLPQNKIQIITGLGFINEYFNLYVANVLNNNKDSNLIIFQHGNIYHTHYVNDYLFEMQEADFMLTWGPKNKKNQIPACNTNVINEKIFSIKKTKNNNLTIIFDKIITRPLPYDLSLEKINNFKKTNDLINTLPENIQQKTYFRFFPSSINLLDDYLKVNSLKNQNINIYEKQESFKNILKKSKICLFNYDSTGLYENFLINVPSIYYCTDNFSDLKFETIEEYNKLKEVKIIFTEEKELTKHLINIWDNPRNWWNNNQTQKAINEFNNKFNRPPKNPFNKIVKCLKSIELN